MLTPGKKIKYEKMENAASIIAKQRELFKALGTYLENYVKEPKDRLEKVDRLELWITRINEKWNQIQVNDDKLLETTPEVEVSQYRNELKFDKYNEKVEKTLKRINERIKALKNGKPADEHGHSSKSISPSTNGDKQKNLISPIADPSPTKNQSSGTDNGNLTTPNPNNNDNLLTTPKLGQVNSPSTKKVGITTPKEDILLNTPINVDDTPRRSPNTIIHRGNLARNLPSPSISNFETMGNEVNSINNVEKQCIQRFQAKGKVFESRLNNIEAMISDGKLDIAIGCHEQLKAKWLDITDDLETVCMIADTNDGYIELYSRLEEQYLNIMAIMGKNQKRERESVEPVTLKLKPIQIAQFSGDFKEWPTFAELFKSLIIENRSLNDVQRMQYLKTNLSGNASRIINKLQIGGDNFSVAWKLLCNRYENKRVITSMCLDSLINYPPISEENAERMQQLLDTSREYMALLKNLTMEQLILHILLRKLPQESIERYESSLKNPKELQDLETFFIYLEQRAQVLQSLYKDNSISKDFKKKDTNCVCCGERHALFTCFKFKKMPLADKQNLVRSKQLCNLCLRGQPNHTAQSCKSKIKCETCGKRHNTLLHIKFDFNDRKPAQPQGNSNSVPTKKSFVCVANEEEEMISCVASDQGARVLLATAQIRVKTEGGWSEELCALIDQGSMATFISEHAVKKLQLKRFKNNVTVSGIGGVKAEKSLGSVNLAFTARYPTTFVGKTKAIILGKLTSLAPVTQIKEKIKQQQEFNELTLADPYVSKDFKVDIILGVDVFASILLQGVIRAESSDLVAQETQLGWILSGALDKEKKEPKNTICLLTTTDEIGEMMKKFWELEEFSNETFFTEEEQKCIEHFQTNTIRDTDGRYIVSMPLNDHITELGNSRRNALAQLLHQERRFDRVPELKRQYTEFINEYIAMGHMTECKNSEPETVYYLPHHAVFKESTTTKLRVVFDASRKTTNGISLNDCMMNGPKLQDDLFNIMLRFRLYKIAFTADVAKMYRQIKINESQQDLLRILWREDRSENIKEYKLTTVTYGTTSAPFLAVKTLIEHAKLESGNYPEACERIQKDFYMDDYMGSCDNLEIASRLQREITTVLAKAGFPLRKWVSNDDKLLEMIPECDREGAASDDDTSISTLGLRWYHTSDQLGFKMSSFKDTKKITKRVILSEISKMYDPLGLLAPFTILCKVLMQKLWIADLSWDDEVPQLIANEWESYKQQMSLLLEFKINRWIGLSETATVELIGFSDSSEVAYGAVIYARVIENNHIRCSIIASKTRVAPLSKQSLPRLELCAAVLLSELMEKVSKALRIPIAAKRYYSDSQITLAWIQGTPRRWETFVANRVAKIQKFSAIHEWRYVNTKENPADMASRGLEPAELIQNELWWHGPTWLLESTEDSDQNSLSKAFETTVGQRKTFVAMNILHDESLIERFSSLHKATRTVAYCNRFAKNSRKRSQNEGNDSTKSYVLEVDELLQAKIQLIKMCQGIHFEEDIEHLKKHEQVSKKSSLRTLYPFLDTDGLLRVGGRLQNSLFGYDKKHPMIIPYKSALTQLIIDSAHKKTLHGGNQLTLAQIRHEFWIIGGSKAIRSYIHKCVRCHRFRAKSSVQLMGNLPIDRTRALVKPFSYTGTDYCGPFTMRMSKNGRIKPIKGYVAIFICFSTKAIHIEAVSDLTADAFIAAFRRFISRRGNVIKLYSDNGTNFIKARKILQLETERALKEYNEEIKEELSKYSTKFCFNPPSAPWFGGLWERNIGSIKYHLKRTVGDRILTYEELTTVLHQIEACLNSRPLCRLTDGPDNTMILTPGHFLIGSALTAPVEPSLSEIRENRLSRWQLCERLKQEFWKIWSDEYISTLQKRNKWTEVNDNLKIGDIVLIKDEINPPLRWPLAKIVATFPGKDGLVRTVEVATGTKIYKRPVGKLAKLPIETNHEQEKNDEKTLKLSSESDKKLIPECDTKRQTRSSSKINSNSAFLAMILVFFGLICTVCGNSQTKYSINKFENEPGLYFEPLNNIQLTKGRWNIVSMIDTGMYKQNYETLKEAAYELEHLCRIKKTRTANRACDQMFNEVSNRLEQIKHYHKLIMIESKREKRGIMAIGGSMALGWAASKVVSFFSDEPSSWSQNEKLIQLLDSKISVLTNAETIMRRNQELLQTEMRLLINQTIDIMDQIDMISRNAETSERSQWLAANILMMLSEFQKMQRIMLEIIVNQNERLHPLWIDAENLRQHIGLIEAHSAENQLQIMGNCIEEKIINIYRMAKTYVSLAKNKVILTIEIPLVTIEQYETYQICPAPIIVNNRFLWIKTSYKVMITNSNHTRYNLLSESAFPGEIDTMFIVNNNSMHCEAEMFFHSNVNINTCSIIVTTESEYWQKINKNKWIYTLSNEVTADIICDELHESIKFNGSGVITLSGGSTLKTNFVELKAQKEDMTTSEMKLHKFALSVFNDSQIDMNREKLNKLLSLNHLVSFEKNYTSQEKDYFCYEKYITMFLIAFLAIICIFVYAKMKIRFITVETM